MSGEAVRLARLEEAQAFADRAAADLSGEVYRLSRRVEDLVRRLEALEHLVRRGLDGPPAPLDGRGGENSTTPSA